MGVQIMKKSFTKLLLLGSLSLSLAASPLYAFSFVDTQGTWAEQSINKLSAEGIINGYPNGTFKPDGLISRAEFSAVLSKALKLPTYNANQGSFSDVKPDFWAYRSIESVSVNEYVSGYPGGYFYPNNNITRAEALTVITKASRVPLLTSAQSDEILNKYTDNASIPNWARSSVATAIKNNIFKPTYSLNGNQYATRADIASYTDNLLLTVNGTQTSNNTTYNPYLQNQQNNNTSSSQTTNNSSDTASVSVVPSDTIFRVVLNTVISSERSQVGDMVSARLEAPLISNDGKIIAQAGSEIRGIITTLEKPQFAEQSAGVIVNFNQVILPDNKNIPISAQINTTDGKLNAATLPDRLLDATKKTATGVAIGSGAAVILAAIKDKSLIPDYLLRGSVIGAGAGLASSVTDKGKSLLLLPGDTIELRLKQTLFISNNGH